MKRHIQAAVAATLVFWAMPSPIEAQDFQTGLSAAQAGDFETASENWRPLAEQGDADAQYNLGVMHDGGDGVPEEDAEAVRGQGYRPKSA